VLRPPRLSDRGRRHWVDVPLRVVTHSEPDTHHGPPLSAAYDQLRKQNVVVVVYLMSTLSPLQVEEIF